MQYNQPYDQPSLPNAPFVNGNPGTGLAGSIPPAGQMEFPQREVVNALAAASLSPTNGDMTQLAQAMSIGLWLGPLGGSANALADTLPTLATTSDGVTQYAIPNLQPGMTFHGIVAATNTGSATLTLIGFGTAPGAKPIFRKDGTPVQGGDLPAGVIVSFKWDGTGYRIVSMVQSDILALITANAPQIVTSSPTVYFRADGNDNVATTNPSQAGGNTAATAFRNPAAAIAWGLSRYFFAGFSLNVVAGTPGTYAHPGPLACTTTVNLIGDTTGTGQANYVLSGAGPAAGGSGCIGTSQGVLNVSGFTLNNTTMINHTVVSTGGRTNLTNCTWTQGTTSTSYNAMLALGGTIGQGPGCIIQGGTYAECRSARCGGAIVISGPLTFSGTPTFNINVHAFDLGGIYVISGADSGSANGSRFNASINGVVDSNGGGANAFAGSSAGATGSGGQSV